MPIGKDSITKRIAKPAPAEPAPAVEPAETKTPVSATGVMGNVSPEVVEKVTGHPEGKPDKPVQLFDEMPTYLL